MTVRPYKTTWHKMRDLVIMSLNVIYIKDTLQMCERLKAKLSYLNLATGSIDVIQDDLRRRKRSVNKRIKTLLEDILNQRQYLPDKEPIYAFYIEVDHASLTKKQLYKGYALYTNIRDVTYALNLRNGSLLPVNNPEESEFQDSTLRLLEYNARHEESMFKFFEIDEEDPLKGEIRY